MAHKESVFGNTSDKISKNSPLNRHILKPVSSSLTCRHDKFPLTSKSDPVNYKNYVLASKKKDSNKMDFNKKNLDKKDSKLSNLFNGYDNEDGENEAFPYAHFNTTRKPRDIPLKELNQNRKQYSNLGNHNASTFQQTTFADAISPSVAGQGNVRFETADEKEVRDREVTNALQMISQSMEPPQHNVDKYRLKVLSYFKPGDGEAGSTFYKFCDFLSGYPFYLYRAFWHYIVLEIHLFYNLGLLFASFFINPPLGLFVVGIILFWFRIIYELYRDIMHRDDALYASNVPKQLSLSAAISASIGFIIKVKSQDGLITEAWWNDPW